MHFRISSPIASKNSSSPIPVSLAHLIGILHIIYKSRGSNAGHSTSPQFNCGSSSH